MNAMTDTTMIAALRRRMAEALAAHESADRDGNAHAARFYSGQAAAYADLLGAWFDADVFENAEAN